MSTRAKSHSKSQTLKNKDFDVLAMSCKKAQAFFLKPESYCNIDLPSYFNFKKILSSVAKILDKKNFLIYQIGHVSMKASIIHSYPTRMGAMPGVHCN